MKPDSYRERVVLNEERNAVIVEEASRLQREGKLPCLIFVRRKEHGEILCRALFASLGLPVPHITAELSNAERESLRRAMIDGRLGMAVCTSVWSTGVDIPNMRGIIWAPAGQAPIGLLQSLGRSTRPAADFEFVDIADVGVDNLEEQAGKRLHHYADAGFDVAKELLQTVHTQQRQAGGSSRFRHSGSDMPPLTREDVIRAHQQLYIWVLWAIVGLLLLSMAGRHCFPS